jgi:hypothetical protein
MSVTRLLLPLGDGLGRIERRDGIFDLFTN